MVTDVTASDHCFPPAREAALFDQRPLTLIWRRRTLDLVPESYFISHALLGELGRPVRVVAVEQITDTPFLHDVLVVSMTTEFAGYLAEARRRGMRNMMLLHLGDEHGTDDRSFYANADLVLRNYWFETIMAERKVTWVPNGYAIGVGPAAPAARLRASQRSSAGFFAGALGMRKLSHEREMMKAAVEQAGVGFELRFTATSRDRLGPAAYSSHLGDARFALVPGGNSPETIRLYDALEMGAVPIMLRSAFVDATDALNAPPFVLLNDWSELAAAYAPFADDLPRALAELDALQDKVVGWWGEFKHLQQKKLRNMIDAVMARQPEKLG
jgi:hypothetical protein